MLAKLAAVVMLALTLAGCGFAMKDTDIPGVYHAARGISSETLTLYADNTYLHEWSVGGQDGRATGQWSIHMLGYGFAQVRLGGYIDRLDPHAEATGEWHTDIRRSTPWDAPRIVIDSGAGLYYTKDRGSG